MVWRFSKYKDSVKRSEVYIYIYAQTFKQIPVMFKLCIIKAHSTWVCWRTGIWRFQCAFMSYGGQCTYRKTDVLFSLFRINIGQGRIYFISCLHKYGYDMTVQPAVYLIYKRDCSLKCSVLFNKRRHVFVKVQHYKSFPRYY